MAHATRIPRFNLSRRDLRRGSGLVLFVYVTSHFANHALGLVSLAAAEAGLRIAVSVWHSLPGTLLLCGAAAVRPRGRWRARARMSPHGSHRNFAGACATRDIRESMSRPSPYPMRCSKPRTSNPPMRRKRFTTLFECFEV